jgi:hypothetical protein
MLPTEAEQLIGNFSLAFAIRFYPLPAFDSDTVLTHLIRLEHFEHRTLSGWWYRYNYEGPYAIVDDAILFDPSTGEQIAVASSVE